MSKETLPYSNLVKSYFEKHPDKYLEIHCGVNAQRDSEWDAMYPANNNVKPSLCLPHLHDYSMYWWPVKDLTIILYWNYLDTNRQIEFSNYLVNVCLAVCVWTLIDDVYTKFMKPDLYHLDRRLAA